MKKPPKYRTNLSPSEEIAFKVWYDQVSNYKKLNKDPDYSNQNYDYRGFWKNEKELRNNILQENTDAHFIDKYKTPGHPTFSNESMYSNDKTPGGSWSQDKNNNWYFTHSPYTANYANKTFKYLEGTGETSILNNDTIRNEMQLNKTKLFNPFLEQYDLGGFIGKGLNAGTGANAMGMAGSMLSGLIPTNKQNGNVSVGGSTAQGALKGFSAGAALGPIGMIGGAAIGGLTSLLQAKQQQEAEQEALLAKQNETSRNTLANMQYGVANASNLPMAMGGMVNPITDSKVGDFSNFAAGGTHEQNPYGGIPQGYNSQGKLRTVEEGEAGFKFNDGKYIFSNRLTFE
jgi:hypothetical protein